MSDAILHPMNALSSLAAIVRRSIDRGDVSAADIAQKVGCDRSTVYGVMNEESQPRLDLAHSIAKACGADLCFVQRKRKAKRTRKVK